MYRRNEEDPGNAVSGMQHTSLGEGTSADNTEVSGFIGQLLQASSEARKNLDILEVCTDLFHMHTYMYIHTYIHVNIQIYVISGVSRWLHWEKWCEIVTKCKALL